jgi:APA family basic amino acid/polyamine antiporter
VLPHYLAGALQAPSLAHHPGDTITSVAAIVLIATARLVRRARLYRFAIALAGLDIVTQALLIVLGLALLFHPHRLASSVDLGTSPTWHGLAFALPVAMLAYTGLETLANLSQEALEPGKNMPRSLFVGLGAAVVVSVLMGIVGIAAFPALGDNPATRLAGDYIQAPLVGIVAAFDGHMPALLVDVMRIAVGLTGAGILIAAATTSISGIGRVVDSLGRHQMLPHVFGTFGRRSTLPPAAILGAAAVSITLVIVSASVGREARFLASLYSFGVLITFAIAQAAVVRLRFKEPDLPRPFFVPVNVRIRGRPVPVAALIGIPLVCALWVITFSTHLAARIGGPAWVLLGVVLYVAARKRRGAGLLEHVEAPNPDLVAAPEGEYERILVPVKLGPIGEEMLATAIKLAEERGGTIHALHVIRVPLSLQLDAEMTEQEDRAVESLAEATSLARAHGVGIEGDTVRARAIGEAIVGKAREISADLIVMGSAPRWRRQSRFFSPTVDYVLRNAPCEVMVLAYPQGILEEELLG